MSLAAMPAFESASLFTSGIGVETAKSFLNKYVMFNAIWMLRPQRGIVTCVMCGVVLIQTEGSLYGIKCSDLTELKVEGAVTK